MSQHAFARHPLATARSEFKPANSGFTETIFRARKKYRARALEDVGLTHLGLHFHDLRHTPGTRVKKMIDLVDIANAHGHKDPKTTAQIYINHTDEDLIDFARAVEQAVEAGYKEVMSEEVKPDQESSLVS